jgi:hypothetical protein
MQNEEAARNVTALFPSNTSNLLEAAGMLVHLALGEQICESSTLP